MIKEVEIKSPIPNLSIGTDYNYKGVYINGYEEGFSKIKRFYKEECYLNNKLITPNKKGEGGGADVFAELENKKIILLGFMDYYGNFINRNNE